jgi:biopolymer transport protein ExbB
LAFSVITWTLILFKLWQFGKNSYYNRRFSSAFWDVPNLATTQTLPETLARGPQARIATKGFTWLDGSQQASGKHLKYQGEPTEQLEQSLLIYMRQEQRALEAGLTMLASIGSTAPFVGLCGTVLGIMHAMHEITRSGSISLDVVAGPIGDALVATAVGIAVAVPAVLAYNFFMRGVKQHRADLENFVAGLMHIVSSADRQGRA